MIYKAPTSIKNQGAMPCWYRDAAVIANCQLNAVRYQMFL